MIWFNWRVLCCKTYSFDMRKPFCVQLVSIKALLFINVDINYVSESVICLLKSILKSPLLLMKYDDSWYTPLQTLNLCKWTLLEMMVKSDQSVLKFTVFIIYPLFFNVFRFCRSLSCGWNNCHTSGTSVCWFIFGLVNSLNKVTIVKSFS